jgi:hypothetical protein
MTVFITILSKVDLEYLIAKQAQYKLVFPGHELVGWYSAGAAFDQDETISYHEAVNNYSYF